MERQDEESKEGITSKRARISDAASTMTKHEAEEKMRDASYDGDVDTVRELVATAHLTGLDVNAQDSTGESALLYACNRGHDEIVRMLLATPGININISNIRGDSPLHLACEEGHLSIVQMLLERDEINIDAKDENGLSPLHRACPWGHVEIARALIAAGASIHAVDDYGDAPLHFASMYVLNIGCVGFVQMLIDTPGINLDARNKRGKTSLHKACWYGHVNVVAVLVAAGANVNAIDHDGATPLHYACRWGKLDAVEVLLQCQTINANARTISRIEITDDDE